ncbi:FAD-dependent oxidoreductase [Cohnella yongneupensis]|uniref:FAD-dependent oxidoreductase n=1 Tax=Cohnella yongneupensis TaxID=425006 RepID=A0ABW0R168_9BACL
MNMKSKLRPNMRYALKYARTLLVLALAIFLLIPQPFAASYNVKIQSQPLVTTLSPAATYDVIVVGTDPEGVMAAVSAARNGLKVLLVEPRPRKVLGGLMTIGWLNSLDLNKSPTINAKFPEKNLNGGLFQEWYKMIQGTSFDVNRAARAFQKMVQDEKNIDLVMNAKQVTPLLEGSKVSGMRLTRDNGKEQTIRAGAIIDATQDADIAAAAGAPYTLLREDLGESPDVRVAVTLVFKISGVTDQVWQEMKQHVGPGGGSDARSIWGYGDARAYKSSDPDRVRIRSLNIGRQDDNTILLNTMQIYGIDPLDPASLEEGIKIGTKEAPLIVDYLKKKYKPFRNVQYAGVAPELYVRESRHIIGEYRLTIADLLENRDFSDAIAYGSYEVDIQGSSTAGKPGSVMTGSIMMNPLQYGVPFRALVPQKIDGLLVVGRSASFDTLPHGSARVIPLGMATGEAAGAAVKLAKDKHKSLRELSRSKADMSELRKRLTQQGMDLKMRDLKAQAYTKHKDYPGLLVAADLFAAVGGYKNEDWGLDEISSPKRFVNVYRKMQKKYPALQSKSDAGSYLKTEDPALKWDDVAYLITQAAGQSVAREQASAWLVDQGWINEQTIKSFGNRNQLTNGDSYMVVRDLVENVTGVKVQ